MVPANKVGEAAIQFIAPYVPIRFHKLGEGAMERAIKKAGADAFDAAKKLYKQIWKEAEANGDIHEVIAQLANAPGSEEHLRVLQEQLIALLEGEQAFNQSLMETLVQAEQMTWQRGISAKSLSKTTEVLGNGNPLTINHYAAESSPRPRLTGKVSNVPWGSRTFVGRDEVLLSLHERLCEEETLAITAIQGMSGIGKTELARQYAQRYINDYSGGLCWVQARDMDVASQIITFAQVYLDLEPPEGLDMPAQLAYCWSHWPRGESRNSDVLIL